MHITRFLRHAALTLSLAAPAAAQEAFVVTSNADDGEGSLRAALSAASALTAPATIVIYVEGDIPIEQPLTYSGTAPLTLFGNANRILTGQNITLLQVTEGADLYLRNLFFEGPGGFSLDNRGDLEGPAGEGIFVGLRGDQTGTVMVEGQNLRISGVAGHGIHVSDCAQADVCADGSAASIALRLSAVEVFDVGHGAFDADGLRVEERGPGDIDAVITGARFADIGGDGVALDEGQEGHVSLRAIGSAFENNGIYCDRERLVGFLPEEPVREFASGVFSRSSVPEEVTGTPDNRCIARDVTLHDNGSVARYAFSIGAEDGLDVTEAGPGDIRLIMERSGIIGNLANGMSIDERDAGGIRATLVGTFARDNEREAYRLSESGEGGVAGALVGAVADGNGGAGFVFSEEGAGDLIVTGYRARSQFNDDGETGIDLRQQGEGSGSLVLTLSQIEDGVQAEGAEVTQD